MTIHRAGPTGLRFPIKPCLYNRPHSQDQRPYIVFTGSWSKKTFRDKDRIDLVPNPHDDLVTATRPKVTIRKYADGDALADALADAMENNGEVDIAFYMPVARLPELPKVTSGITIKVVGGRYHYMMFENLDTLSDVRVRRAMDLAMDRNALTQNTLTEAIAGGTATRRRFPRLFGLLLSQRPVRRNCDPETATAALLDEAGWTLFAIAAAGGPMRKARRSPPVSFRVSSPAPTWPRCHPSSPPP